MRAIKRTIVEMVILAVVGVVVAVSTNAVRAKGLILTKNYFRTVGPRALLEQPNVGQEPPAKVGTGSQGEVIAKKSDDEQPDHAFQKISFEQVKALFHDDGAANGAVVFIDARNDKAFEEGHIPGAIQADHFHLENCIEMLLDYVEGAEKVIIYCNGGKCEDSIFLCDDLMEFEVPYERIFLYGGGWKEWVKNGMPKALGRQKEASEE